MRRLLFTLAISLLLVSSVFAADQEVTIQDFSGGLNDWYDPAMIGDNQSPDCANVLTDEKGLISTRKGYAVYSTTSGITQNLYTARFADGSEYILRHSGSMVSYLSAAGVWTSLKSNMNSGYQVSFETFKNKLIWVNGYDYCQTWNGTSVVEDTSVPKGNWITLHKNRLWVSGETNNKSVVFYSEDGWTGTTSTQWLANSIEIDPDDGDVIKGTFSFQDMLVVFKERSTWAILGDWPPYALRKIHSRIGSLYGRSVETTENRIIWMGREGFYSFDGSVIKKISDPVRNLFSDIQQGQVYYKSWMVTSKSDFEEGTIGSKIWDTATYSGELRLEAQDTDAEFNLGTKTSVTVASNQVKLVLQEQIDEQQTSKNSHLALSGGFPTIKHDVHPSQSFKIEGTRTNTKIDLYLSEAIYEGQHPSNLVVYLKADSSNSPGSTLRSETVTSSSLADYPSFSWTTVDWSDYSLTGGTRYWIQLAYEGDTNNVGNIYWGAKDTDVYGNGNAWTKYDGNFTWDTCFKIYTNMYDLSGDLISQVLDYGVVPSTFGTLAANCSAPTDTTIKFKTASSTYSTGGFDTWTYIGSAGENNGTINSGLKRYLKWGAYFTSNTDRNQTPTLNSVYVGGQYISRKNDCGASISEWGIWEANYSLPSNTTGYFEVKFATGSAALDTTSWTSITPGTKITVSTSTYWTQWRYTTRTTNYANQPVLSAVTVNWQEGGSQTTPINAFRWKDRYYVFFVKGTGVANNYGLVWTPEETWFPITGCNFSGATLYKDKIYTGSSENDGKIYYFDTGYNDKGAGIVGYWTSKRITFGAPNRDKVLKYIWLICEPSGYYNVTISYRADGGNWYSEDIYLGGKTGLMKRKISVPKGIMGTSFDIKISNSNPNEPFRVHGLTLIGEILPLRY